MLSGRRNSAERFRQAIAHEAGGREPREHIIAHGRLAALHRRRGQEFDIGLEAQESAPWSIALRLGAASVSSMRPACESGCSAWINPAVQDARRARAGGA